MPRNSNTLAALLIALVLPTSFASAQIFAEVDDLAAAKREFTGKDFTFRDVERIEDKPGIGLEEGITRRDPSDVVKLGDTYFVYYTYVDQKTLPPDLQRLRASGYAKATIRFATSRNQGLHWVEEGLALGPGKAGAFDSFSIFTPNIVKFGERYYLYYTGVHPTPGSTTFENNSTNDFTALGVAVADSPRGPFTRLSDEPILSVTPKSTDPARPSPFDSFRIDDASLLARDHDGDGDLDLWLYYKGRNIDHGQGGPGKTQMGLAIADTPAGPYVRQNGGRPILASSHEVLIWPHRSGVAAYASASRTLEFAPDGINFMEKPLAVRTPNKPIAPGCFRTDLGVPETFGRGISWGVSMMNPGGPFPYLVQYEINLLAPYPGPARDADGKIPDNTVWHLGHSANVLKIDGRLLVFDFPYATTAQDETLRQLEPEEILDENVYVFSSHHHGDHHTSRIYRWQGKIPRLRFIMPEYMTRRPDDPVLVAPGGEIELDGMRIRAYPATDQGVAYSIYVGGKHIYFSGDNGYWNVKGDQTPKQYIEEDLATLDRDTPIDIAFQVCDPLLESMGKSDGGAASFAKAFQPKLLIPIHLRGDYAFPGVIAERLKEQGFRGRFWTPGRVGDVLRF